MATFDTEIQAARERFGRAGEYPLIDDAAIIDEKALYQFWPWDCRLRRAEELFRQALTSDHYDIPVRFVYLNLFFRLAHYPAEDIASVVEDQQGAAGYRAQFLEYLGTLLDLVDPNNYEDPRTVRWEIVNACSIRRWIRARELYDRLESMVEKHEVAEVFAPPEVTHVAATSGPFAACGPIPRDILAELLCVG